MKTKRCSLCHKIKDIGEFYIRNNRKHNRTSRCGQCLNKIMREKYNPELMRGYDLMKLYGITHKDYLRMLKQQDGKCAICNRPEPEVTKKHKKFLCIDHDHKSRIVRGLLCDSCNRGIGLLKDDPAILSSAISYLQNYDTRTT